MDVFEKITKLAQTIIDLAVIDTDSNTQIILKCAKDIIEVARAGNAHLPINSVPSSLNKSVISGSPSKDSALAPSPFDETSKNASFIDLPLKEVIRKCIKGELQDLSLTPAQSMPPQLSSNNKQPFTLIVESKETHYVDLKELWIEYPFNELDFAPLCELQLTKDELRIDFETFSQRRLVSNALNKTLSQKFTCHEIDRIKPFVVVRGIPKEILPNELQNTIYSQNPTVKEVVEKDYPEATVTVETTRNELNHYRALLAVSLRGWHALISLGKLQIGNETARVEDYVRVEQCNSCLQYGHNSIKCTKNVTICSHCASENHTLNYSCRNPINCYNCKSKPLTEHLGFEPHVPGHSATSSVCPHWKLARDRVRLLTRNGIKPVLFRPDL